jgi:hypothetical protein
VTKMSLPNQSFLLHNPHVNNCLYSPALSFPVTERRFNLI